MKLFIIPILLTVFSSVALALTHAVYPGESIQTAINNASAGDIIAISPGVYTETVTINKDVLLTQIEGLGDVRISGTVNVNRSTIFKGFVVRDTVNINTSGSVKLLNNNVEHLNISSGQLLAKNCTFRGVGSDGGSDTLIEFDNCLISSPGGICRVNLDCEGSIILKNCTINIHNMPGQNSSNCLRFGSNNHTKELTKFVLYNCDINSYYPLVVDSLKSWIGYNRFSGSNVASNRSLELMNNFDKAFIIGNTFHGRIYSNKDNSDSNDGLYIFNNSFENIPYAFFDMHNTGMNNGTIMIYNNTISMVDDYTSTAINEQDCDSIQIRNNVFSPSSATIMLNIGAEFEYNEGILRENFNGIYFSETNDGRLDQDPRYVDIGSDTNTKGINGGIFANLAGLPLGSKPLLISFDIEDYGFYEGDYETLTIDSGLGVSK